MCRYVIVWDDQSESEFEAQNDLEAIKEITSFVVCNEVGEILRNELFRVDEVDESTEIITKIEYTRMRVDDVSTSYSLLLASTKSYH